MNQTDYLERKFIAELNQEGEIEIKGNIFYRDTILKELEPEGYKIAFNEWKDERRQNLLNIAENIIQKFDNKDRFYKLKEVYHKNCVLPFIGAGLSCSSGFPLWRDFLKHVHKEINNDSTEFNNLLDNAEFEQAAELLEKHDATYLQEQMENIFGKSCNTNELDGVICRLPEFFPNSSIVTTNYDDLIKIIYENNNNSFREYLIGLEYPIFSRYIKEKSRVLLKLHGNYRSKRQRILTASDYERHYDVNNNIHECISSLFSQSVLFLGCSLNTDRTIKKLIEITQNSDVNLLPKHYTFLDCSQLTETERRKKRKQLNKANIFPIWYQGEHDESIEALLELLIEKGEIL